jgi:signal transduction histidine kinase
MWARRGRWEWLERRQQCVHDSGCLTGTEDGGEREHTSMKNRQGLLKAVLIATLIVATTVLHYGTIQGHLGPHILHRQLYVLPIMLASFWFGLRLGLITSLAISVIYASHPLLYEDPQGTFLAVGSQVLMFNLVAVVLGWLADRQKRQQQEVLAAENLAVLGRAAVAVGHDMMNVLRVLKGLAQQKEELQCTQVDRDFQEEMARLERSVELLSSFAAPERVPAFSHDLNETVRDRIGRLQDAARRAGVTLLAALDDRGCPVQVNPERVAWVLENVLKNAIEVSKPGQRVSVRTQRTGTECRIEVADQGPGIRPEHLPKIFTPFFTTKEKGSGLALAGCKKIMRDLGGDILVTSAWGEGATFILTIPREQGTRLAV